MAKRLLFVPQCMSDLEGRFNVVRPHWLTLPETNSSLLKIGHPKRKLAFQPSIFRCYVSFREGKRYLMISWFCLMVLCFVLLFVCQRSHLVAIVDRSGHWVVLACLVICARGQGKTSANNNKNASFCHPANQGTNEHHPFPIKKQIYKWWLLHFYVRLQGDI